MAQSVQVKAVNWRHEALADLMLTEPHLTLTEMAERLKLCPAWVSIVKQSDSFKDYWALRRKSHSDSLTTGIREKAAALAELSLDVLLKSTVERADAGALSAQEARDNLDLVAKRFGFDGTANQQVQAPTVNLNLGLVTSEALEAARLRMRSIKAQEVSPAVVDVQPTPIGVLEEEGK